MRPRVDAAAWRALFGIVCAHLSAPGGPRVPGESAPGVRLLPAPSPPPPASRLGPQEGARGKLQGGPYPRSPAPERGAEGRGPQVRGQGLGDCGCRREPRINPEPLGAVVESPNLAAAEGACLLSKGFGTCPRPSRILQSFCRCYSCCYAVFPGS